MPRRENLEAEGAVARVLAARRRKETPRRVGAGDSEEFVFSTDSVAGARDPPVWMAYAVTWPACLSVPISPYKWMELDGHFAGLMIHSNSVRIHSNSAKNESIQIQLDRAIS